MEYKVPVFAVRGLVEVVDTLGIKKRSPPLDAMYDVPLFEQKLRQIGAVLASNAGDKGFFHFLSILCDFGYSKISWAIALISLIMTNLVDCLLIGGIEPEAPGEKWKNSYSYSDSPYQFYFPTYVLLYSRAITPTY